MTVKEHIENAQGQTLFSIEILPPLKGRNIDSIFNHLDPLMAYNPAFINVTYHREEYHYKPVGDKGLLKKQVSKKRPGTVGICSAIQHRYKVDAIPHILCGGFTKEDTENFLIDLDFLGINNVLALRGDAVKNETYFKPEPDGNAHASDLVEQIQNLNHGKYLDNELTNCHSTNFCIGAAAYPEKHVEAPSNHSDLEFLKHKVDQGADYLVTQMFYDNQKYFDFVKRCRDFGITVPIIPGLKPLTTKRHLTILPHRFNVDLPDELVDAVRACDTAEAVKQVGIDWCITQSKELKAAGVPVIHYYSMGKSGPVHQVLDAVFKEQLKVEEKNSLVENEIVSTNP